MSQAVHVSRANATHDALTRIWKLIPHPDTTRIAYGVKLALAILIAVWIELWFDLGMADSVAICVLVVKSNLLGTTIFKSALRMLGNLIGCSVGLGLIALFAQDRVAGTLVYSLYSVVCCYFLQRSRYAPAWHWIYDSAAIVFVFHLGSATESFTFTAERWLELSIGILSMTFVSSILWPSRAGSAFEHKLLSMLKQLADSVDSLRHGFDSSTPRTPASKSDLLASGIPALRNYLDTASRDTSRYEKFYEGYQAVLYELQSLIARNVRLADGVAQWIGPTSKLDEAQPAQPPHFDMIADAFQHLSQALDELAEFVKRHFEDPQSPLNPPDTRDVRAAVKRVRLKMAKANGSLRGNATALYVCEMLASLVDEIEQFSSVLQDAERGRHKPAKLSAIQTLDSDDTPFWKRLDVRKALVSGLTVALTFVFWMLTNWPAGTFAVFFAVLITSKNCTAPYLPPIALIPGAMVGILVGSVIYLGALPALDGFLELALVLFSFCAVGGYLMLSSNAKVAGVAGLTTIVAVKLMNLQAHQTVSFSHVVGFSYGVLGGTFLAFIVLSVLWPVVPEKMFTGQMKTIFRSCQQRLSAVSSDPGTGAATRTAFAQKSAKQFSLCVMWGRFLNYKRLPSDSRATIDRLHAAIQSTLLHLIELDRIRQSRNPAAPSTDLSVLANRLDQELCNALDRLVVSLEACRPIPRLPDAKGLLEDLNQAFNQLSDGTGDDTARRDAAVHALVVIGQYGALVRALSECHAQLEALDWQSLNESYF